MAEFLAETVLRKIGILAYEEIDRAWGVISELEKLKRTLDCVKAVLLDAEEQQAKNLQVRDWLEELQDIFYDADDVLDEFEILAAWREVNRHDLRRKVRHFFSHLNPIVFRFKIGRKIMDIRRRLEGCADKKRLFNLTERTVAGDVNEDVFRKRTVDCVPAPENFGRDNDKERIIELLMHSSDHENVTVIPIVGMGGIGKTVLAKLVLCDKTVTANFELRMWVTVRFNFDVEKMIARIIESATGSKHDDFDLVRLPKILEENVCCKRFLLVLDDVWNCERRDWLRFRNLLKDGSSGSKIVVTTRDDRIATIVGTVRTYQLQALSDEDCFSVFACHAFKNRHGYIDENRREIGMEIVKKCGGIPLAAKVLGSILHYRREQEWVYIRTLGLWEIEPADDDILSVLKLSYDHLPLQLKRCFLYCAIFPKNYEIEVDKLIQLWIAQGLIDMQEPYCDMEMEDTGTCYVHQLLERSLFYEVERYGTVLKTCRMHTLIHDLALSIAKKAQLTGPLDSLPQRARHVSFSQCASSGEEDRIFELASRNIRTILFPLEGVGPTTEHFANSCFSKFRRLRVLDLSDSSFSVLPASVGLLIHLRYLDLSRNHNIKTLPISICSLQGLQTLRVWDCKGLENLPKGIGKMVNLRHLYVTTEEICLPGKGIASLKSLRSLNLFRCSNLTSLCQGLQHLTALSVLTIRDCPNFVELPDCVGNLLSLELLEILGCPKLLALPEGMHRLKSSTVLRINGCTQLSRRCQREIGEDWLKIAHIRDLILD